MDQCYSRSQKIVRTTLHDLGMEIVQLVKMLKDAGGRETANEGCN